MKNPERAIISILAGIVAGLVYLLLAGCTSTPIVQDRPVRVAVPVTQPCAGERPAAVVPLKDQPLDWTALDVKQKAALVARQGLDHKTYGEKLSAATAACP